jgi:hypothetical protein
VIVALVAVGIALQLFIPSEDTGAFEPTTYGTRRNGFRVVHDLLVELGAPVERFHDEIGRLPTSGTAWWIAPFGVCAGSDDDRTTALLGWVRGGGTAVVFLPDPTASDRTCRFAGSAMHLEGLDADANRRLSGMGPNRVVEAGRLRTFRNLDEGWTVRARWAGQPFIVERSDGSGRLVVVADAKILENETLADDDAALFAVDLVRAFGPPRIVEAEQRLLDARSRSAILYLLRSPAVPLFAGLVLTGILAAWRGALVPPRTIDAEPLPAPTLQTFVASLARLYAGSRDYARLLARYRDLTARRLRPHLGLPPHASLDAVAERIERTHPRLEGVRSALVDERPATADAFHAAVARLDTLAAEVIG